MNTKKLLLIALTVMCAISVQAQQLREGHFFKTFSDVQPTAEAAPALFDQWFALPEGTEWREISRQTDNIGMERIEYRQSRWNIHRCCCTSETVVSCLLTAP